MAIFTKADVDAAVEQITAAGFPAKYEQSGFPDGEDDEIEIGGHLGWTVGIQLCPYGRYIILNRYTDEASPEGFTSQTIAMPESMADAARLAIAKLKEV